MKHLDRQGLLLALGMLLVGLFDLYCQDLHTGTLFIVGGLLTLFIELRRAAQRQNTYR